MLLPPELQRAGATLATIARRDDEARRQALSELERYDALRWRWCQLLSSRLPWPLHSGGGPQAWPLLDRLVSIFPLSEPGVMAARLAASGGNAQAPREG